MLLVRGWILCSGCWEGDGGEMEERAAVESGKEEGEQSGAADKQSSTQHTQTPTTATLIHIHSLPTTSQLSPITHLAPRVSRRILFTRAVVCTFCPAHAPALPAVAHASARSRKSHAYSCLNSLYFDTHIVSRNVIINTASFDWDNSYATGSVTRA